MVTYVPNYYWKSTLLWVVDQTLVINYFICNKIHEIVLNCEYIYIFYFILFYFSRTTIVDQYWA